MRLRTRHMLQHLLWISQKSVSVFIRFFFFIYLLPFAEIVRLFYVLIFAKEDKLFFKSKLYIYSETRRLLEFNLYLYLNLITLKSVSFGDSKQPFRTELALCVNIQSLPFGSIRINRQLAGHRQLVAQLCFACTKFAKKLGHASRFDAATKKLIQFTTTCIENYDKTKVNVTHKTLWFALIRYSCCMWEIAFGSITYRLNANDSQICVNFFFKEGELAWTLTTVGRTQTIWMPYT